MYEFVSLSFPIRHVHPDDEIGNSSCDPGMIDKLNDFNISKTNEEGNTDSRWDSLKKLLDNE